MHVHLVIQIDCDTQTYIICNIQGRILLLLSQRENTGLTLIEVMVVVAMISILSLLAIPSFRALVQRYRISGESEKLYTTLQYARTESIKRNTTVFVSFATGDDWCYGVNTGSACDCTTPSSCDLGVSAASDTGQISLSATGLTSNAFSFESTHGGANGTVTVTMTLFGQTPFIRTNITRLGNIIQCSTGISGYRAC